MFSGLLWTCALSGHSVERRSGVDYVPLCRDRLRDGNRFSLLRNNCWPAAVFDNTLGWPSQDQFDVLWDKNPGMPTAVSPWFWYPTVTVLSTVRTVRSVLVTVGLTRTGIAHISEPQDTRQRRYWRYQLDFPLLGTSCSRTKPYSFGRLSW